MPKTCLLYTSSLARKDSKARIPLWMLAAMSLLPLALVWIAGIWIPAASPWRIQFALPGLYALVAVAYSQIEENKKFLALIASLGVAALILQNTFFSYQYLFNPKNHREEMCIRDSRSGGHVNQQVHEIEEEGLKSADHIIAVSQYTKNIVMDQYSIKSHKIDVVHNGVHQSGDPDRCV